MSEKQTLDARFKADREAGKVKDLKFFLAPVSEMTAEDVCGEVNHFLDAYEKGNFTRIESWSDSNRVR